MKLPHLLPTIGLLAACFWTVAAQEVLIKERGSHEQRVESYTEGQDAAGNALTITNSYVELATGLNRWEPGAPNDKGADGAWIAASPEIEILKDKAVARKAQHKVVFNSDILDPEGTMDLLMPDGVTRLVMSPVGIALSDATGKSVWLAEVRSAIGEVTPDNTVFYPDCFTGLKGMIRYRMSLAGVEQDVVLQESPNLTEEDIAALGIDTKTASLECWTQVMNEAAPQITERMVEQTTGRFGQDEFIDFGPMFMPLGKAFQTGETDGPFVLKQWVTVPDEKGANVTFLVESVDWDVAKVQLDTLPKAEARNFDKNKAQKLIAKSSRGTGSFNLSNSRFHFKERRKPVSGALVQVESKREKSEIHLASAPDLRRAFVVDYTMLSTGQANYRFRGDSTYYVTAPCIMSGSAPGTTFESSAVIKFTPTNSPKLTITGPVIWGGSSYRPVIFTGKDDLSVGEAISGAGTMTPASRYAAIALEIQAGTAGADAVLQNIRICNAQTAIAIVGRSGNTVDHAQIINCDVGIQATSTEFKLRNGLFVNVLTNFLGSGSVTGRVEHVTTDIANWFTSGISSMFVTNSLLVAVANGGTYTSSAVSSAASSNTVFAALGQGGHYLPTGSAYKNAGVANVSIANTLRQMSTDRPLLLTNDFTSNTILNPTAQRDTDTLDLGFHYWPVDYFLSSLNISNASVTLTNGAAAGYYGATAFKFRTGSKLLCTGTPLSLNRLTRFELVQEMPGDWGASPSTVLDTSLAVGGSPEIRFAFTDISLEAGSVRGWFITGNDQCFLNPMSFSHSSLRGAYFYLFNSYYGGAVAFTNNIFERADCHILETTGLGPYPITANLYNNLFYHSSLTFNTVTATPPWAAIDNLFETSPSRTGTGTFTTDYNGYASGLTSLGGTHNKTGLILDFVSGPLGNFYYPASGGSTSLASLIDTGSRNATNAGLYQFTTLAASATKEANCTVDIGYHSVGVDGSGNPIDSDGDGLPDYLEDRNGNGSVDIAESDWNEADTDYDGRTDADEYADGTDPRDPSSVKKVLLASWKFNTTAFLGEQGQIPIAPTTSATLLANWSPNAANFGTTGNALHYNETDNGRANINCRNGTVRFWYKPNSSAVGANGVTFLALGDGDGQLAFGLLGSTGNFTFETLTNGSTITRLLGQGGQPYTLAAARWCQIALTYSPSNVALYCNGQAVALTGNDARPITGSKYAITNSGVRYYPNKFSRSLNGVYIGSNQSGNTGINGAMDELETYNYPMSPQEIAAGYPLFAGAASLTTDTDYDGRSDLLEDYADGTSKTDGNAAAKARLGYFRFNTADLKGEQGQVPLNTNSLTQVASWSGNALAFTSSSSRLVIRDVETNGWANFNCRTGAVRFWFKPKWGGSGPGAAPFIYMGNSSPSVSEWSLGVNSGGNQITFNTTSNSLGGTSFSTAATFVSNQWQHIVFNYSPSGISLYTNGMLAGSSGGITKYPNVTDRLNGLMIGNSTAGNVGITGQFEEIETFNYNLSQAEISDSFEALHGLDNDLNGVLDLAEELHLATPAPLLDQAWAITGTIEAEQFDKGGPTVAYTNTVANPTSTYRVCGLCITNCNDLGGGYCLDRLHAGEWVKYTLDVRVAGTYAVESRLSAASAGGVFKVEFFTNNTALVAWTTNNLTITTTNWQDLAYKMVSLPAGTNVMKVSFLTNGADGVTVGRLNYISVYPAWDDSLPASPQTNNVTGLVAGSDYISASNNAVRIQAAINSLPATGGGVVVIPSGTYYVAQSNPDDTQQAKTNSAIYINRNHTEILGQGKTSTTLIAHNRSTTVFFGGGNSAGAITPSTNTIISDIGMLARPHLVFTNSLGLKTTYYEAGALKTDQPNPGWSGGAVICYMGGTQFGFSPSSTHTIQNCRFTDIACAILTDDANNICIRSNDFLHPAGTNVYSTTVTYATNTTVGLFGGGVSVRSDALWYLKNILVTDNTFNGNPDLSPFPQGYVSYPAADGLVWFQQGGNWFFARNSLTNNSFEGFQVNAGPASFIQNSFVTQITNRGATVAFNNYRAGWRGVSGLTNGSPTLPQDLEADEFFYMVGNTVNGERSGESAGYDDGVNHSFPGKISFCGNLLSLSPGFEIQNDYPGYGVGILGSDWLNVSGNKLSQGGHGVGFVEGYTTYSPQTNIFILNNDFTGATYRGIALEGTPQTQKKTLIYNNTLNQGLGYHFKSYQADAWSTFILNNKYLSGTNVVPIFIDSANASYHFPN